MARDGPRVSSGVDPGSDSNGPNRVGTLLGSIWPVCLLHGKWDPHHDAAATEGAIDLGFSSLGTRRRHRVAGADFDFCRGAKDSIFSLFLLCPCRRRVPLGPVGNVRNGGCRSSFVMVRKDDDSYLAGAGRVADSARAGWAECQSQGVRSAAAFHVVHLPARDGAASGISGGAAKTSSSRESRGYRDIVAGARRGRTDWHYRADLQRDYVHVRSFPSDDCFPGNPQSSSFCWRNEQAQRKLAGGISLARVGDPRCQDLPRQFPRGSVLRVCGQR